MEVLLRRHGGDGGATSGAQQWWRCYCGGTTVMEVLLRRHNSDGGSTAGVQQWWRFYCWGTAVMEVLLRGHGGNGGATVGAQQWWRCYCGGTVVMEVLLWRHGGDGGATSGAQQWWRCYCGGTTVMEVLLRRHGGDGGATAGARRWWRCYCGGTAVMEVLLRGHGGDGGATAEARRWWRFYCGGTAVMEVVLRRHGGDGGATAGARRWWRFYCGGTAVMEVLLRSLYGVMVVPRRPHCGLAQPSVALRKFWTCSKFPPRKAAVLTVFRGATAINDGTTAEPRRSWRCHCGLCRTSTAVAPGLRCDGGITRLASKHDQQPMSWLPELQRLSQSHIEEYCLECVPINQVNQLRGQLGLQCSNAVNLYTFSTFIYCFKIKICSATLLNQTYIVRVLLVWSQSVSNLWNAVNVLGQAVTIHSDT